MTTKPATPLEAERDDELAPSASSRFRLKMDAFGRLIPEVVPVDEDLKEKPAP